MRPPISLLYFVESFAPQHHPQQIHTQQSHSYLAFLSRLLAIDSLFYYHLCDVGVFCCCCFWCAPFSCFQENQRIARYKSSTAMNTTYIHMYCTYIYIFFLCLLSHILSDFHVIPSAWNEPVITITFMVVRLFITSSYSKKAVMPILWIGSTSKTMPTTTMMLPSLFVRT